MERQGVLPFRYEEEVQQAGMTAMAGLPVYMDLAAVVGLSRSIMRHLRVREDAQGWEDRQVITSLVLLNLCGGEHVDDLTLMEADEGLCQLMRRVELHGFKRRERREIERRWRKERRRTFPSPTAVFRYLSSFHDKEQEKLRVKGKAFIPAPNIHLKGLGEVSKDFVEFMQRHNTQETATLDMDATLVETSKENALHCYKKFKAYQPLNVWWAEQEMVLYTEFRDGNVPAGHEQRRVLAEALEHLPESVKSVRMRSDSAGYQHDLLKYCEKGESKRFGRIEFAVCCDVTEDFKKAVGEVEEKEWRPLYKEVEGKKVKTGREWAEVCFVPNAIGHSKSGPEYRYLAIREALRQLVLPGMEGQTILPFPTMNMQTKPYKVFGIVTNMDWEGGELINWNYERCGKSEEAHAVMKDDLAGGVMPSGDFGENAAWWWCMVLALNLNAIMKRLVLGKAWASKRMKAIRFAFINLPGRILDRSRQLFIRLSQGHPSLEIMLNARLRIVQLAHAPPC